MPFPADTLIDQQPHALLPPNSTPLEIAIADLAPRPALETAADAPRRLKSEPSESVLPWLASEWFLADFVKYFPTLTDLIANGLPWLMERGTAAAVKRALNWIGLPVAKVEEDGSRLQLDTGRVVTAEELPDLVHLVLASIPAHVDLYRMYHGYDLRMIGLSQPEALDEGLLSDDSGVWVNVDGEDVKLSFRLLYSSHVVVPGIRVTSSLRELCYAHLVYEDRFRLDYSELDSEIVPNRMFVAGQIVSTETEPLADPANLGLVFTEAKSALGLSNDTAFGDINCGFAGFMILEFNPMSLSGDQPLSDYDNGLQHHYIDERFDMPLSPPAHLVLPTPTLQPGMAQAHVSGVARRGRWSDRWRGGWSDQADGLLRRWSDPINHPTTRMTTSRMTRSEKWPTS